MRPSGRLGLGAAVPLVVALAIGCANREEAGGGEPRPGCAQPRASAAYTARMARALRARTDVWGEELIAAPGGPTYAAAQRLVSPLLLAGAPLKQRLTATGFHYVPFSGQVGEWGSSVLSLHVADGSQILADRAEGRALTVYAGRERYGACAGRLTTGRLVDGWLPILRTRYVDADGNRYEQESFAARMQDLTTAVAVTVHARRTVVVRVAAAGGSSRALRVEAGDTRTLRVGWQRGPEVLLLSRARYDAARAALVRDWTGRLAGGASVEVPERVVMDAVRALLVQNLTLTWRYSVGNQYEQFSFPEGLDQAQVMAEWGHGAVSRSILRTSLTRRPTPYANWKMGEKLVGTAVHYRLLRDRAYVEAVTPVLLAYVEELGGQVAASPRGLLAAERFSSDIPDTVYGLHTHAVVWQGLRAMAGVWDDMGNGAAATRARGVATRLEPGLRRAVSRSQRRLPDGSLFVPMSLLSGEQPYGSVTEARLGSYWNLVAPYAFASGLFRPGSAEAEGVFRYMRLHGSRLLGLVRAGAYSLYEEPSPPTGGTDEVYGINAARFLADNDEADQLVLSLYGQLAVAMTPGTFVGGEAASVEPVRGAFHRVTYLPPNAASNGAFLTKVRLMLVHELRDAAGEPAGLRLAFSTPRGWLQPGRRIAVHGMPTSFGPLSYELRAGERSLKATIEVPARRAPAALALRLRLPDGRRLLGVRVGGRPHSRFDPASGTIDLTGARGRVELVAETT